MTLPFTFSWVFEDQTTFDPSTMNVFDEDVFSFNIDHEEGQIPTLDLEIKNPRIGLLNPGRKVWGWLGWQNGSTLVPIFFGVLVGVPTNLFKEKITIRLIARSPQFIANKQAVAETMKAPPYYDPIWLETAKRDDPDSILEGWASLWHVDRTSLAVTASDILTGEDGTVTFTEDDAFYESVELSLGQAPLSNIRVEASVNWTQRSSGFISVPQVNISSYTGESLVSDWPKPGAGLGGGYKCEFSFVSDNYLVALTPTASYNSSWNNTDPDIGQCSNSSASSSSSGPALLSPNPLTCILTSYYQTGLCFPDSDPPVNRPMTASASGFIVPLWNVTLDMTIRYDAHRQFSELLTFDMTADTQDILTSPTVEQHTELLTLSSVDISQPLVQVEAWTDFAGQSVGLAQIIFPNNPTKPGGLSYQICVVAGTAGTTEPVFSDVVGFTTTDNTVTWASLGTTSLTSAPGWSPVSFVPLGQIINFQNQIFQPSTGEWEDVPGATSYYICTKSGETNNVYSDFSYTPPVVSNVEPPPAIRHISHINAPRFSVTPGDHVSDGSVIWTVLGQTPATLGIPIGGSSSNVTARSFFPTARGLVSVEYLISRARARLRMRSRAVKISWECPFNLAVGLSCRKNATLFDPRLPGGAATGKITRYNLSARSNGQIRGRVEIGCSVGFGNSIVEITGTPEYAASGYAQLGWQRYDGAMIAHGSNETTFSPPVYVPFDDGLQFPLRWQDISDGGRVSGTLAAQAAAIQASFATEQQLQYLNSFGGVINSGNTSTQQSGRSPDFAWKLEREQIALVTQNTPYVMNANPISWSCVLKPCAGNGPFGGAYSIQVSPLVVPEGINLLAPSSP